MEGLRPLATRTGLPLGQIRSLLAGRAVRSTTLERMTSVLGVTLHIGPPHEGAGAPSGLLAEIGACRHGWLHFAVADTVGVLDFERAAIAAQLREGAGAVKDLADRAATAAASLLHLVSGWDPAPPSPLVKIPLVSGLRSEDGGEAAAPEAAIRVPAGSLASWANPDALRCLRVPDAAMDATISAGGFAAFDPGRTEPLDGELFVLETETGATVRRLRHRDHWVVTGDNPDEAPRPLSDADRILGQVAWHGPTGVSDDDS